MHWLPFTKQTYTGSTDGMTDGWYVRNDTFGLCSEWLYMPSPSSRKEIQIQVKAPRDNDAHAIGALLA